MHDARRAGIHADLRLGTPGTGLLSWVVPKARLPDTHGQSLLAVAQPVHGHAYGSFEGELPSGRGAGTVRIGEKGRAAILGSSPGLLRFVLLNRKHPEEFRLARKRDGGDAWFLTNVTPTGGSDASRYGKAKYRSTDDPEAELTPDARVSPKIDGAAVLVRLLAGRAEVSSVRDRASGGPIRHTWRLDRLGGLRVPEGQQGAVRWPPVPVRHRLGTERPGGKHGGEPGMGRRGPVALGRRRLQDGAATGAGPDAQSRQRRGQRGRRRRPSARPAPPVQGREGRAAGHLPAPGGGHAQLGRRQVQTVLPRRHGPGLPERGLRQPGVVRGAGKRPSALDAEALPGARLIPTPHYARRSGREANERALAEARRLLA
jgi:hypothetical protein